MEWNAVAEEIMKPLENLLVEIKEVAIHAREISIEMDAVLSSVRRDIEIVAEEMGQKLEPGDYEIIIPNRKNEFITCDGKETRRRYISDEERTI
jgi:hypothetical protein